MPRYIDADALLQNLKKQYGEDLGWQCTVNMSDIGMMIEDAPTADFVEVKHGRWKGAGLGDYLCSECWEVYSGGNDFNYCPNCGAKMGGDN